MSKPLQLTRHLFLAYAFFWAASVVSQTTVNFNCGPATSWTVPPCVTSLSIVIHGAQGGGSAGGMGASLTGNLAVTPGQVLTISVGCQPTGVAGGTGGGGAGQNASGGGNSSFGGGGASSISVNGTLVLVAGGGGGTGGGNTDASGGNAGCPNGSGGTSPFGQGGGGATTGSGGSGGPPWISSGSAGTAGSFGQGGAGGPDPCYNLGPGGGGGGGYYGGGGGGSDCFSSGSLGGGGGGGGSSLIPGGFSCTGNHAGSGSVSITYSGGVSVATASNGGPYCSNQTIQLNSTGGGPYSWSGPGGYTSSVQNPTRPSSTVAMSGVYTVTVGSGGCTATATTNVVVNPTPTVTVPSATMCPGTSATLTASGAGSYAWSPATGLSATTGSTVVASPASTTVYTITGTSGTCTSTTTATVTVGGSVVPTVNSGTICAGSAMTLTANGATSYTWNPGTGLSSTTGSTVTANPGVTTVYTITAATGGCFGTTTSTVTVINNPTVTVTTGTICAGSSTSLTASGASSYAWSPGTGLSSTSGSVVTANPGTTQDYTVIGTAGTCTAVATTTVTVNPLPVVSIGSNSPLCVNQTLNLTSGGGTSFSWSGPNSFSSTQQNPSVSSVTSADAGTYTVTVTDANSCVNTNTVQVVVNPLPVVIATGNTVCVTQTINLSCNNSGVAYSWLGPNNFTSNQQNPSIPGATTAMTGTYVVTVTDANGCVSGNVASVLVNPALIINASSNSPICQNQTLNLSSTSGIAWSWSGPNSFSSAAQNPNIPGAQVNATGTYTVVGTDANGCQGTATTQVAVNPLPVITANSGTICIGQQTANLTAGGASTYTWAPSASLNSSFGASVNATPSVTTVYTITATDVNSCVNTGTTSVLVNPLPNVTVNSATICIGNSSTLTANGASTYTWSPAGGLSSPAGSPVTANPTSTTVYNVTGVDGNGCYSSATSTVVVNPLPTVSVNSATLCVGSTKTLTATGANTYAWSPATGLSSASGASVNASPQSSTAYTVTGTDINGCVNTANALVTVNPLPVINVSPSTASGCAPVCVSLANTTSVSGTCSWNFGDNSTSASCLPTHCYFGQGTFFSVLTFTDNNGCVRKDTSIITVYPVPDANFSFTPQPTTILDPLIYFNDGSSGAVIASWQWSFGDPGNNTASTQNASFNYGNAGEYPATLVVTSNFGCKDSITQTVIIENDYSIYVPNAFTPNSDGLNDVFKVKAEGIKDFKLYIFDRWGNLCYFSDDAEKGWDGTFKSKGGDILTEDVYVWKIELKNFKNEPKQLKGTVSLLK
jgi:gliding motility-associated-like protein